MQSLHSPPSFNDDDQLQLLPSAGNQSHSIHHTPLKPGHVDGNPMLQVSADYPIRSAQSRLFASPPVRQAASDKDTDQGEQLVALSVVSLCTLNLQISFTDLCVGGVASEDQTSHLKHITSLSWSRQTPILSLGIRDNTQEVPTAQLTFPSTAATTRYSMNVRSV